MKIYEKVILIFFKFARITEITWYFSTVSTIERPLHQKAFAKASINNRLGPYQPWRRPRIVNVLKFIA